MPQVPDISVVIPTKNRSHLLQETIASLVAQTYPSWEAIIVDDGSNDDTEEVVTQLSQKDDRIKFIRRRREPAGAPTCRNLGFCASHGKFVIYLDSDDLLAPKCLSDRLQALHDHPQWAFVATMGKVFHDQPGDTDLYWNSFEGHDDLDRVLRADSPWQTAGPLWRRETVEAIGPWDEAAVSWQDWEFHARALMLNIPYGKLPVCDYFWRATRPDSISSTWQNPGKIVSRIELVGRIKKRLRNTRKLTLRRRRTLASLSFHMIAGSAYRGDTELANRLTDVALGAGTISTVESFGLRALIRLMCKGKKLSARAATHLLWRWTKRLDPYSLSSESRGFATVAPGAHQILT